MILLFFSFVLHKHFDSYEELVHSLWPNCTATFGQESGSRICWYEKDKIQWTRAESFPYNCPVKTFIYDPERWCSRFTSKCFQGKFKMCIRWVWWKAADAVIYLSRCSGQITDVKVSGPIIHIKQFLCPALSVHAAGYMPVITLWVGWWQPVPSAWCFSIIPLRSACTPITHNCTE